MPSASLCPLSSGALGAGAHRLSGGDRSLLGEGAEKGTKRSWVRVGVCLQCLGLSGGSLAGPHQGWWEAGTFGASRGGRRGQAAGAVALALSEGR